MTNEIPMIIYSIYLVIVPVGHGTILLFKNYNKNKNINELVMIAINVNI